MKYCSIFFSENTTNTVLKNTSAFEESKVYLNYWTNEWIALWVISIVKFSAIMSSDNLILYEVLKQEDAFSLLSQKLLKILAYFTAIQCGTKMLTLQESCWLKQLTLDHFKQYIFTECWPYLKKYYKEYIPTSQRSCKI